MRNWSGHANPKETKGEKKNWPGNGSQVERRRLIAKASLQARLRVGLVSAAPEKNADMAQSITSIVRSLRLT